MELIVRGLVALALIDCPPDAEVCPSSAAILIPDTSYFEKLGLHEHSATLSIPLAWIDFAHSHVGGYHVIDNDMEPIAVLPEPSVLNRSDSLPRPVFPVLVFARSAKCPTAMLKPPVSMLDRAS